MQSCETLRTGYLRPTHLCTPSAHPLSIRFTPSPLPLHSPCTPSSHVLREGLGTAWEQTIPADNSPFTPFDTSSTPDSNTFHSLLTPSSLHPASPLPTGVEKRARHHRAADDPHSHPDHPLFTSHPDQMAQPTHTPTHSYPPPGITRGTRHRLAADDLTRHLRVHIRPHPIHTPTPVHTRFTSVHTICTSHSHPTPRC